MNLKRGRAIRLVPFLLLFLPNVTWSAEYEDPPVLSAQDGANNIPLETKIYRVEDQVQTDGFMATYVIETEFGQFSASGPGMLAVRLNEIRALAALEHMETDERFVEAAQDTAEDTFGNLRQLVKKPKETLKGVPDGVGRFFKRTGRSAKTGLQKLGDSRNGHLPGVDPGSASALPGGSSGQQAIPNDSLAESVARTGGDVAVNILGFDKQRRRLAKELGVDPYTTNQALADKLDQVTWAAFAGGLGVNVLTSLVPGGLVLTSSSRLSDWVWDTAPGDLRVGVEDSLLSIDVPREQVDRFLRHSYYTLSMQVVVAESLKSLDGVQGRAEIIPLVLSVGSEGQARFLVQTLDMLRTYHLTRTSFAELREQGTIVGITIDTGTVIMAPVDHLSWTAVLDNFASKVESNGDVPVSLYASGEVSRIAGDNLMKLAWVVEDHSSISPEAYPLR